VVTNTTTKIKPLKINKLKPGTALVIVQMYIPTIEIAIMSKPIVFSLIAFYGLATVAYGEGVMGRAPMAFLAGRMG